MDLKDAQEEVISAVKKSRKLVDRIRVSDQSLLSTDPDTLKFHTGVWDSPHFLIEKFE